MFWKQACEQVLSTLGYVPFLFHFEILNYRFCHFSFNFPCSSFLPEFCVIPDSKDWGVGECAFSPLLSFSKSSVHISCFNIDGHLY